MLKKLFKKTEKNVVDKKATKLEILNTKEVNKIIGGNLESIQDEFADPKFVVKK